MRTKVVALGIAMIMFAGFITAGVEASQSGRKNTTYALGAAALYELSRGKTLPGLLLAGGTYVAYRRIKDKHGRSHYHRVRVRTHDPRQYGQYQYKNSQYGNTHYGHHFH